MFDVNKLLPPEILYSRFRLLQSLQVSTAAGVGQMRLTAVKRFKKKQPNTIHTVHKKSFGLTSHLYSNRYKKIRTVTYQILFFF